MSAREPRPRRPARPGFRINAGNPYTADTAVELHLRWPAGATAAWVANDGGFAAARKGALAPTVAWQLDNSVPGRSTKVIHVRFTGNDVDDTKTFSDDVILDMQPPTPVRARQRRSRELDHLETGPSALTRRGSRPTSWVLGSYEVRQSITTCTDRLLDGVAVDDRLGRSRRRAKESGGSRCLVRPPSSTNAEPSNVPGLPVTLPG